MLLEQPTHSRDADRKRILKTEQSDVTQHGYLFSAVVIFLGNMATLLVGVPLLTARVGVLTSLGWWLESTGQLLHGLQGLLRSFH